MRDRGRSSGLLVRLVREAINDAPQTCSLEVFSPAMAAQNRKLHTAVERELRAGGGEVADLLTCVERLRNALRQRSHLRGSPASLPPLDC